MRVTARTMRNLRRHTLVRPRDGCRRRLRTEHSLAMKETKTLGGRREKEIINHYEGADGW
jgi:hypothetical protein